MTEAVFAVRRARGVAHAEDGGEGGGRVHEAVHGRGEQRDRAGDDPGRELDRNQDDSDSETGAAGEPAQARVPLGGGGHRSVIGHRPRPPIAEF